MVKEKISLLGLFVNFILFVSKLTIGLIANSTAILADAVNSGSDIFASGINVLGIRAAKKPADKEHPYGHQKFEVLAGFIVTLIIFGSALFIIYKAILGFLNPGIPIIGYLSLGVMIFSATINEVMARVKLHYGKKENSIALMADGTHSRIDFITSLGVLVGLILSKYWIYADPLVALLMGIWILRESIEIGKEATDSLLDSSINTEKEEELKKIIKKENLKLNELKTQKKGSHFSVNISLALPSKLKIEDASKIKEKLRKKLMNVFPEINYITISSTEDKTATHFYKGLQNQKWTGKRRMQGKNSPGGGPEGFCICEKCGYKIKHERGVPCSTIKCPKCKIPLVRENAKTM